MCHAATPWSSLVQQRGWKVDGEKVLAQASEEKVPQEEGCEKLQVNLSFMLMLLMLPNGASSTRSPSDTR